MNNISRWAIRHPVPPIVLFVVLFFVGVVAFVRLPINLDPDINYPLVSVTVGQPGAAPTEIETQIIQKVEASVANIGNVHNISRSPWKVRHRQHRVPDRYADRSRRGGCA